MCYLMDYDFGVALEENNFNFETRILYCKVQRILAALTFFSVEQGTECQIVGAVDLFIQNWSPS
jgi:hypothetical protein